VNPNLPIRTYLCNGKWSTTGPSATAAIRINTGGDDSIFQKMRELFNAGKYAEVLTVCNAQIQSTPEWLTPYLFCGLGYLETGNTQKARQMMDHYDKHTGPSYDDVPCHQMSDLLHNILK
jgi:hypothetical protein